MHWTSIWGQNCNLDHHLDLYMLKYLYHCMYQYSDPFQRCTKCMAAGAAE